MTREQRRILLYAAERYVSLGYNVGLTQEKALIGEYQSRNPFASDRERSVHIPKNKDWEGISIILKGLVCVDFDTENVPVECKAAPKRKQLLPLTWTERTRRGWHYFYRLPAGQFNSRIAFREGLDLLTKEPSKVVVSGGYFAQPRRNPQDQNWYGHALVSPTEGYQLVTMPIAYDKLPRAPKWILQALKE